MGDIAIIYAVADDSIIVIGDETSMMFISLSHSFQTARRVDYKVLNKACCSNVQKESSGSVLVTQAETLAIKLTLERVDLRQVLDL
jgi:hypothetical protein